VVGTVVTGKDSESDSSPIMAQAIPSTSHARAAAGGARRAAAGPVQSVTGATLAD